MIYDTPFRYLTFIEFNPFLKYTEWDKLAVMAEDYFLHFLNAKDYGENVMPIDFHFLVEKDIDISNQNDTVSTSTYLGISKKARLTVHLDYECFTSSSEELKYQIILNGILFLLNYWKNNLKTPKNMPLEEIISDFKCKLETDNLFDETLEKIYIKITAPFKFTFNKHNFSGLVYDDRENEIKSYAEGIEKYLNNNLYKYNFGKSVNEIFFSYDIFDFDNPEYRQYIGKENEYRYGNRKDLFIIQQYNSNLFTDKTKCEQTAYFCCGILEAIDKIEMMKRKPKDFNVKEFYSVIDKLMKEYTEYGSTV